MIGPAMHTPGTKTVTQQSLRFEREREKMIFYFHNVCSNLLLSDGIRVPKQKQGPGAGVEILRKGATVYGIQHTRSSETRLQLNVFALVADAGDYKLGTTD